MKILVTGANGQLGSVLKDIAKERPSDQWIWTNVAELDLCDDAAVFRMLSAEKPDWVFNCAAYTAVEKAEDDAALARKVNETAVVSLADACGKLSIGLIHISTDFVFNGQHFRPYLETDEPEPVSVYGATKLAGEKAAFSSSYTVGVLRTAWLYSEYGNNFVKTMRKLARRDGQIRVVADQIGTPTSAIDLARAMIACAEQLKPGEKELFHFTDEGVASWYDLAHAAVELSGIPCTVIPLRTEDYPVRAKRPAYSVLNKTKIKERLGINIPHWRDSLRACIARMAE